MVICSQWGRVKIARVQLVSCPFSSTQFKDIIIGGWELGFLRVHLVLKSWFVFLTVYVSVGNLFEALVYLSVKGDCTTYPVD